MTKEEGSIQLATQRGPSVVPLQNLIPLNSLAQPGLIFVLEPQNVFIPSLRKSAGVACLRQADETWGQT
jgi:hypothetical protein